MGGLAMAGGLAMVIFESFMSRRAFGKQLELGLLQDLGRVIVVVLAVMGVLTKLLGGIIGSWRLGKWNSIVVGLGMSPRGEVGIVVSALGLSLGLISNDIYAVLLAAVILTTLVAPVTLQWAIPRAPRDERHPEGAGGTV